MYVTSNNRVPKFFAHGRPYGTGVRETAARLDTSQKYGWPGSESITGRPLKAPKSKD